MLDSAAQGAGDGGDAGAVVGGADQADRDVAQGGHHAGGAAGADLGAVLIEGGVTDLLRGSACGSGASVGGFPFVRRLIGRS